MCQIFTEITISSLLETGYTVKRINLIGMRWMKLRNKFIYLIIYLLFDFRVYLKPFFIEMNLY